MLKADRQPIFDRVLRRRDLLSRLAELGANRRIVGPVARGDRFFYEEVVDVRQLDLSFNYCVYGLKSFLFPPTETLFTFDHKNGRFNTRPVRNTRPMVFVGVHPCDIHAIRLLDRVFRTQYRDENYLARRRNLFIVGIDCARPCTPGVFCRDMHTHEASEGFDVMLYPLEDGSFSEPRYGIDLGSEAGRRWVHHGGPAEIPTERDWNALDRYRREKEAAFPRQLRTEFEDLPKLVERSYDSLLWEAMARGCYSCGSCNLACPTCYCFNISDELSLNGQSGERRREWDGCMLHDFALVAGGHNFRSKASQRLRHRIFRKAAWIRERASLAGCVGCARCSRACTAKISIVDILNQLAEEKSDAG